MGNQLYTGQNNNIFPNNYIENIRDKETNTPLSDILSGYNSLFLAYTGDAESTRLNVPKLSRHNGLFIHYVDYNNNHITEYYRGNSINDEEWKNSSNWRLGNNTFMGELSISSNGTWVINNEDTGIPARGETGTTPLIRFGSNNKFQVSYNNGDAWKDLTNEITSQLKISKYIGVNKNLPTSGITEGTIYMKGPYYEDDDTLHEYPSYRMWIYAWKDNTLAWQDNGEFTSISAGIVQETGDSENVVMSQKAVSGKLAELESDMYGYIFTSIPFPNVGALEKSGAAFYSASNFNYTDYIKVKEGDRFYIECLTGSSETFATICGYTDIEESSFVSVLVPAFDSETKKAAFEIPAGISYIRASGLNDTDARFKKRVFGLLTTDSIKESINDINQTTENIYAKILDVESEVESCNVDFISGGYYTITNSFEGNTSFSYSGH